MASALLLQLNSQTRYLADGSQTAFNFTFSGNDSSLKYISREHVKAFYIEAGDESQTRHEYAVSDSNFIGDYQLNLTPAPPAGSELVIYRDTPKDKPLVDWADGANVSELTLDTIAKQAIFVAAEALDQAGFSDELGYKAMKQVPYVGASQLQIIDNGRAHYKEDATTVTVGNDLPVEYLTTIINNSDDRMTVNADEVSFYRQGVEGAPVTTFDIAARNTATLTKVSDGVVFVNGYVIVV